MLHRQQVNVALTGLIKAVVIGANKAAQILPEGLMAQRALIQTGILSQESALCHEIDTALKYG